MCARGISVRTKAVAPIAPIATIPTPFLKLIKIDIIFIILYLIYEPMPKTIFNVQACLPVLHHLRVVGTSPEFGQWSPFESVQLVVVRQRTQGQTR